MSEAVNFFSVKTYRAIGMEARWTKVGGRPAISLRDPQAAGKHQRERWWVMDQSMLDTMKEVGIREGFDRHTMLGDIFSIPAR